MKADSHRAFASLLRVMPLFLSFAFLFAAIVAAFHSMPGIFPSILIWTSGDAAAACAGFGTVSAIFFGLHQFSSQRLAEASKFSLEMAMNGVRQAYEVIMADAPKRSIAWVNAARLLERSKRNAAEISDRAHREAWDLFHEEWRIRFFGLLGAAPEYFCGIGKWTAHADTVVVDDAFATQISQQAFRESSITTPNVSGTSHDELFVQPHIIKIVYDFTEYDSTWVDPISNRDGFGDEISNPLFQRNLMGLWGYLELRNKYLLSMGTARRRKADSA